MLSINLKDKVAFVAGIGDDQGFGWAIAKALAEAGAKIVVGTWPPIYKIFTTSFENGKFDASRTLSDGSLMTFEEVVPFDAAYDQPEDIPDSVLENKRYKEYSGYTISETASYLGNKYGKLDVVVHSIANAPEAKNTLLNTSRKGYLEAVSNSAYSFVSLVQSFGPICNPQASVLSLSYLAADKVIPGYGGGLNAAKAALESDTRYLAYEAGREFSIRVNAISAGPMASRAAKAIGFIEKMVDYSAANAPLAKPLIASEVGNTAAFLLSPLASAITGTVVYVDNGAHAMGVALDSPTLSQSK